MKKVRGFFLGLIMSVAVQGFAADALTEALQKGLFEEEANQNLEAAIKAYQDVLGRADEQRRVAATALFRLAECYRKQGKTNEASAEYRRLVRDYSEQATLVNLSRQNLVGLGVNPTVSTATTQNSEAVTTNEEQQEVQRIRALIKNSPDLINAGKQTGGGTILHGAAAKGHLLVAEYLLANGADIDALDGSNATPLYHAALKGHKRMVELLLSKGAQPSPADAAQPLHAAVELGFKGVVEVLLAHKVDVNATPPMEAPRSGGPPFLNAGMTALHVAIKEKNLSMAELLANGANANAVYSRTWRQIGALHALDAHDGTPLHFAVQGGNPALVRMLLAKGADANVRTTHAGLAPLHYVANAKLSPDVAKSLAEMLLEGGAKIDGAGTDGSQLPGWTPLHIAVYHKLPQLAQLLLEKGADPNLPLTTQTGNERTALNMAVSAGATEIVDLLLKHKADANARDHNGDTPLVRAMRERNHSMVELLLSKGADPNALDANGSPPLHVAVDAQPQGPFQPAIPSAIPLRTIPGRTVRQPTPNQPVVTGYGGVPQPFVVPGVPPPSQSSPPSQEPSLVELLLKYKADPDQRDEAKEKDHETALHLASRNGKQPVVELLLKYKADPNARTDSGATPLHWAVQTRGEGIVDLLLAHNADVKAAKNDGDTALHSAAAQGLTNVVAKLVQRGADINACGDNGETPLHKTIRAPGASQLYQVATVAFLLKAGADMLKRCDNHLNAFEDAVLREKSLPGGMSGLVDFFRKHYPKKLAAATFDGAVVKPVWVWEADKPVTLSEAIAAVGLKDTADPTRITIMRSDPDTGVRGERYNLALIREKQASDVPLKHGDKITVAARAD